MNLKLYLLSTLIILGVNLNSKAQVSYNKRAIGNIGTVPKASDFLNGASLDEVDMSTGTLKVGIPLYEIKVNDISVPIMLNYSALGLKVGQEAGLPGMGWELSAGGKIITNVQGRIDDGTYGMNWSSSSIPEVFDIHEHSTYDKTLLQDMIDGKKDNAWDTYNYILPNGGGTFIKGGATFPYDPFVKIDYTNKIIQTTDGLIYDFGSGDKRKRTKQINYTKGQTPAYIPGGGTDPSPLVWDDYDLESITSSKSKDVVNFSYKRLFYETGVDRPRLVAKSRTSTSESLPMYRDVKAAHPTLGGVTHTTYDQFYKILEPMVSKSKTEYLVHSILEKIEFPNGKVTFDYDADVLGRDVLANIRVFQKVGNQEIMLKRYEFIYDLQKTYGHYLIGIRILDQNNNISSGWEFSYYGKLPLAPNVESNAQDRWGFYNSKLTNKTLLEGPNHTLSLKMRPHYPIRNDYNDYGQSITYTRPENTEHYGTATPAVDPDPYDGITPYTINFADRTANGTVAQLGSLIRIKTPTGGTYSYEYESHKFRYWEYSSLSGSASTQIVTGGGIRIKSITKRLGHDNLYYGMNGVEKISKKVYNYGDATFEDVASPTLASGWGDGTIPGNLVGNTSAYYYSGASTPYSYVKNLMLLSHPVNDMVQRGGSYVMYRAVTEILNVDESGDAGTHGKTVYYSSRPVSPHQDWLYPGGGVGEDPYVPITIANPGVKRDEGPGIVGIRKYSYKDGTYHPIEEIKYTFTSFNAPVDPANKMLSVFASTTGQVSGPVPTYSQPIMVDEAQYSSRGGTIEYYFNSLSKQGNLGSMDFLTRTNYGDEEYTPYYPGKYDIKVIDLNTLSTCLKKTREQRYLNTDETSILYNVTTNYYYDNPTHLLPTRITSTNSKGDITTKRIKYPLDYFSQSTSLQFMKSSKMGLSEPIEEYVTYIKNNKEFIKSGVLNRFTVWNNAVLPWETYKMKVPGNEYEYTNSFSSLEHWDGAIDSILFKPVAVYNYYIKGNIHKYTENSGASNIIYWGYDNQYPIARITNSANIDYTNGRTTDVAYTSFEAKDTCNWVYPGLPIIEPAGPSGKMIYNLSSGSISKINSTQTGKYVLSYWFKTGASVNVTGGTVGAAIIKNSWGNWQLAEHELSGTISSVTVSGSGFIDELRFHPKDAQMTTYLYEPLIGLTGVIDANGRGQYYEYDGSQRLKNIKDQDGNIVKSYKYIIGSEN